MNKLKKILGIKNSNADQIQLDPSDQIFEFNKIGARPRISHNNRKTTRGRKRQIVYGNNTSKVIYHNN